MKISNLIKNIPFLLTLITLILLNISNQKQFTRLKILIWQTPSLSLGNYLAISTGTGFVISYILTNNLSRGQKLNLKQELKYKFENQQEATYKNQESNNENSYDNTFIERDVKEPSPTINASFRIIGKGYNKNESLQNNQYNKYDSSTFSDDSYNQSYEQEINYENNKQINEISNDWEDDSYTNW